jgi:hypothetical protein
MVRAVLDGSKTQTRRVVKPAPQMVKDGGIHDWQGDAGSLMRLLDKEGRTCPYGGSGDRLWVREAWRAARGWDQTKPALIPQGSPVRFEADGSAINLDAWDEDEPREYGKLRPNIFIPRWASRIDLEITGIRVERLQDCSEADAKSEGIHSEPYVWRDCEYPLPDIAYRATQEATSRFSSPRDAYRDLWEQINGPGSWDANPWVWCISFKVIKPQQEFDIPHFLRKGND